MTAIYVMLNFMDDLKYMKRALFLAQKAHGKTSPNPMVGAVIVKAGKVISEGYHKQAGLPHAEAEALSQAGKKASGATLYVTLEPCCHTGKRTPPCTDSIISHGVKRVVIAMKDPNPSVSGKGINKLKRAGIDVEFGLLRERAQELNHAYVKHITTGIPFVTLKCAMTFDGKIATPEGQSKWITGPEARKAVHKMRAQSDAIITAIGTVKADDPQMTARTGKTINKDRPIRVIIDPELKISPKACVLDMPPQTIIVTKHPDNPKVKKLEGRGIKLLRYKGTLKLKWLLKSLSKMGIMSVMAEGGASFNWHCIDEGIVDRVVFFVAPKIIGGNKSFSAVGGDSFRNLQDAVKLGKISSRKVGDDIMLTADVIK